MSYIALYRKWRPSVFEDVVEQEHVVKTLKYSVETGRIAHAYLFCGTRGTGKTTMAKIFSRAINCLNPRNGDPCNECEICKAILSGSILDVVEIDAASNNSVDNVREIRDEVVYAPSQAKHKVYIIDEVHMLSTGAFNALLKTLEEPPSHVVFILATTEPHKLPATILSRCQRFDFRRITVESIIDRLNRIAEANGVVIEKEAARLIARLSDGALRDAISILDQCMSLGDKNIGYDNVLAVVGISNDTFIAGMADAIIERNVNGVLELVERLVMDGKDITRFVSDLVLYFRNLLICKVTAKPEEIIEISREAMERMKNQSRNLAQEGMMFVIKEMSALESSLKWATHPRVLLEVSLVKLCEFDINVDIEGILRKLSELENKINSGSFTPNQAVKADDGKKAGERNGDSVGEKKHPAKISSVKAAAGNLSASGGIPLGNWENIIDEIKSMRRMAIYTNLLGTRAIELEDGRVGIVFPEGGGFGKMLVSKAENMEVIESVTGKMLGREVRIKCLDEEGLAENSKAADGSDEFMEKVKKLNVPFNVIDE